MTTKNQLFTNLSGLTLPPSLQEKVTLGEDVSVWPMAVIRGDVNTISVGSKTNIQDGAVLHCTHDGPYTRGGKALTIGDRVTIGHQSVPTWLYRG